MKNRTTAWRSPTRPSRYGDGARAGVYPANGGSLAIFLVLLLATGHLPLQATGVTGTVKLPDGTAVNGTIEFILSQQARTISPPALYANMKTTCSITSGAIAGGCTVQGNDTLDPAGTFYSVKIVDSNNVEIMPATQYTISGASVDLGTLAIAADATLQLPSGTVTGNLTITGNLTVSGTSALNGGITWLPPFNVVNTVAGAIPFTVKGASGQTADLFQLQNSSSTVLSAFNSAGRLGIGTASPASPLHIIRSAGAFGLRVDAAASSQSDAIMKDGDSAVDEKSVQIVNVAGLFAVRGLNDAESAIVSEIIAADLTNGFVGIGHEAPDTQLHVKGDGKFKNSADSAISLKLDSGSTAGQIAAFELVDRGTVKYQMQKNATNDFAIFDVAASLSRAAFAAAGSNTFRPAGSGHNDFVSPAGTLRVRLQGDADKVSFGSSTDASLERISAGQLLVTDLFAFDEMTAPSAPVANRVLLYAKDNGSGKTQLCVIFNSGAEQCFATQP